MKKKYFKKLGKNTSKKVIIFLHFSMLQNWQRTHFKWRQVQKVLRAYLFAQFSQMPYTPTYLLVKKVNSETQNRKLENSVNVHCEKKILWKTRQKHFKKRHHFWAFFDVSKLATNSFQVTPSPKSAPSVFVCTSFSNTVYPNLPSCEKSNLWVQVLKTSKWV